MINAQFAIGKDENRNYFVSLLKQTADTFKNGRRVNHETLVAVPEGEPEIRANMPMEELETEQEKLRILKEYETLETVETNEGIRDHSQLYQQCLGVFNAIHDKYSNPPISERRRKFREFFQDFFNFYFSLRKSDARAFLVELTQKVGAELGNRDGGARTFTLQKLNTLADISREGNPRSQEEMEIYKEKTEILKKMREFTTITDDADFDLHAELLKWTSDIMSNVSNKFETPDPAFQGAN